MIIKNFVDLAMEQEEVEINTTGENGRTIYKGLAYGIPEKLLEEEIVSWNSMEEHLSLNIGDDDDYCEVEDECGKMPEGYPNTDADKINYANFCLTKSLEHLSPAISKCQRLERMNDLKAPKIIIENEVRMTLEKIFLLSDCVHNAVTELEIVWRRNKK